MHNHKGFRHNRFKRENDTKVNSQNSKEMEIYDDKAQAEVECLIAYLCRKQYVNSGISTMSKGKNFNKT